MSTSNTDRSPELNLRAAVLRHIREESVRWRIRRIAAPVAIAGIIIGGGFTYAAAAVGDFIDSGSQDASDYPSVEHRTAAEIRAPLLRQLDDLVGGEGALVLSVDGQPNGFSSLIVDADSPALTLYWKGELPTSVADIIAAYPEVAVDVVDARYTLVEMSLARDAIAGNLDERLNGQGSLVWVGPDKFGRGINIGIQTEDGQLTEGAVRRIVAEITPLTLVQVEFSDEGVTLF